MNIWKGSCVNIFLKYLAACAIIIFTNIEDIEDWWERKLSGFATKFQRSMHRHLSLLWV